MSSLWDACQAAAAKATEAAAPAPDPPPPRPALAPAPQPLTTDPPPKRARHAPLPPASFYSAGATSSLTSLLAAVDARVARTRAAPALPPPSFPRQAPAFDAADSAPDHARVRVFSEEVAGGRGRRYVVDSVAGVWRRYRTLPPSARHFYEILREGDPCHMYLDIEFKKALNPGVDGDALTEALVCALREEVSSLFSLTVDDTDILELDASSDTKFSRHITLHMPGAVLATTADAGALARAAVKRAAAMATPSPVTIVADDSGKPGLALDLGVYTRNRAWRMPLSSKAAAPHRPLRPTERWGGAAASERAAFFCGLVGDVTDGSRLLQIEGARYGGGGGAPARGRGGSTGAGARPRRALTSLAARPGPSPLPAVDAFIEGTAADASRDPATAVRTWALSGATLVLALRVGRFCGAIGRPHKSNGVYYVVDLAAGLYHQRCHDPECAGYRGEWERLPGDVVRSAAAVVAAATTAAATAGDDDPLDDASALAAMDAAVSDALAARTGGAFDDDAALVAAVDGAVAAELTRRAEGG